MAKAKAKKKRKYRDTNPCYWAIEDIVIMSLIARMLMVRMKPHKRPKKPATTNRSKRH
jgi:hypothetical protein